jgi:hypothetical protein
MAEYTQSDDLTSTWQIDGDNDNWILAKDASISAKIVNSGRIVGGVSDGDGELTLVNRGRMVG